MSHLAIQLFCWICLRISYQKPFEIKTIRFIFQLIKYLLCQCRYVMPSIRLRSYKYFPGFLLWVLFNKLNYKLQIFLCSHIIIIMKIIRILCLIQITKPNSDWLFDIDYVCFVIPSLWVAHQFDILGDSDGAHFGYHASYARATWTAIGPPD